MVRSGPSSYRREDLGCPPGDGDRRPQPLEPCVYDLCKATRQDCISGKLFVRNDPVHEFLTGSKAAEYGGAFDPTYWLKVTCDNAPKPVAETLANLMVDRTLGNGPWARYRTPLTCSGLSMSQATKLAAATLTWKSAKGEPDRLRQHVFATLSIVTLLRQAGVEVDREFE